ncbi:tyrosine-type recombinase/integrase [Dethiobacter alkaliphilus]|uniref:tyrosine-type recombinase/integrase n=1 Tax=Dethiobacter alkaliphilus TaxID=427926 RepID=UPI00222637F2|nr:tyrosine-type recombinase/integrase [Dethiobacter alkaliphilus]MCW3490303.1 tyrosine-type recombinase/integrase [Dethiobacter alkaliphilus]
MYDAFKMYKQRLEIVNYSSKTIDLYIRDLNYLLHYIERTINGPIYLSELTSGDLEEFLHCLKKKGIAPNSLNRYLYTFRSFYKFAVKKELVIRDISRLIDPVKLPYKERQYLTKDEIEQLMDAVNHQLIKLVVLFLANTGLRISECLALTLDDVDLETKIIHVTQGKGGRDRNVPINNRLYSELTDYKDNWRDAYGSNLFFATKKTGSLSAVYTNSIIRKTAKELGWRKKVSCHILRHSFASNLVRNKVGLVEIQKLLGHSSLATTSVYTHADMEQLNEAVNTL